MNNTMNENELARILLEGVPFQPGDIVECVDDSYSSFLKLGQAYTIKQAINLHGGLLLIKMVESDVNSSYYYSNRFVYHFPE